MFKDLQLDRRLQLGIESMDLTTLTEVQRQVIPIALAGSDLEISAETGSGKTLAYLVPLTQRILAGEPDRQAATQLLILVPTRELARQVLRQCRQLLAKSPLHAQAITGGADFKYQQAIFRKNPEIIVATPGRLVDHIERGSTDFSTLQALVLDEADRMLDMGFREDVLKINAHCAPTKQVIMLSATLRHQGLKRISGTLLKSPQAIAIGQIRQPHSSIFHQVVLADSQEHKDRLLLALLQQGGYQRALVFGNKRTTATRLAGLLSHHGLRSACLHGELSTEQRKQVMTQYADSKLDIVCASELAARGLDVKDIDLVINYDLPRSGDDYLHRTGRTGRAGARGLAISLVAAGEWNLMISIERYLKLKFERRALPGLKARYSGPKRTKSSGKAAGSKKKAGKTAAARGKNRLRRQKSRGKPKSTAAPEKTGDNDGFAPLMKKRKTD